MVHNGSEKGDFSPLKVNISRHPYCSYLRENTLQMQNTHPVIRTPDVSGQCFQAHGVILGVSYTGSAVGLDDPLQLIYSMIISNAL